MFEQIPDRPTGAQSIEPHIVLVRRGLVAFVKEHLQDGWELGDQDGLVWITFKREITNADFNAFVRAHYRGTKRKESGLFRTRVKLLASAGKMGAWGFNLPAGPPGYFGTCIGSVPGFPTLDPEQQGLVRSHAAEGVEIQPERTICSGCYALKGRYGSPSQQFQLEVRRQVTVDLLAGPAGVKRFADTFERAIVMAQAWSMRAVAELKRRKMTGLIYTIENPAFFRLHDSGDLYSRKYLQAWVEVASRFAKPRRAEGLRLPAITFWVPTRTWFARGLSGNHASVCPQTEDLKCVPPNMVIRPSSMHFGDKAPDLASIGYSAGTSAAKAAERGLLADWACPATLPPSLGGGAEPDPRRPGRWIQGCCARSTGPRTIDKPAPAGHGCRTCWLLPAQSVAYMEH